jgi:uncharacterized membrane protein YedE/YeeE
MRLLVALAAGALFGGGLIVSDMVNPARVLGFLDVAGAWDPTLAFVMAGALGPMIVAWRLAARRGAPVCGRSFPDRPAGGINRRLIGGSALFGAGWGLVGFCPGPALTALGTGNSSALIFTAAMVAGMLAHDRSRAAMRTV